MQAGVGELEAVLARFAFEQGWFGACFDVVAERGVARGVVHVVGCCFDQALMQRVAIDVFLRDEREVDVGQRFQVMGRPQRADHAGGFVGVLATGQQKAAAAAGEITA